MDSKQLTYYAVFFHDKKWACSLFYELPIFTQEKTIEEALKATKKGVEDTKRQHEEKGLPLEAPLSKEEVERRAIEDEKRGCVSEGWQLVPINIFC